MDVRRKVAIEQIQEEHRHLRELLEAAEQVFQAREASRDAVRDLVRSLQREVLEHFQHEETGGCFSDALEAAPRLSERAEHLLEEHRLMAEEVTEWLQVIDKGEQDAAWWEEVGGRFERFAKRLHAHELAETALLQEAYMDDIGSTD